PPRRLAGAGRRDAHRAGLVGVSADPVELAAFGRPIRGPSALGGDFRRFLHLTWTLAVTDFKLRFFGSVLGYLWQLLRPVMLFGLARGVTPRLSWLEIPLLLLFLGVLVTGVAMLLSSLYVRFRDVRPIWEVVAQALFYGSPVIYVIDHLQHASFRKPIMMNPIADVLTQARRAVVDPHAPSAAYVIGGGA